MARLTWIWRAAGALCLATACASCTAASSAPIAPELRSRFVIVMVDETDSFAGDPQGTGKVSFWPEAIALAQSVVNELQPGDKFAFVGINDQDFSPDSIMIPVREIDLSFLKSVPEKRKLKAEVGKLQPRKARYQSTNILGALYLAANLAAGQSGYDTVVLVFSDMHQFPKMPGVRDVNFSFPQETEGQFFYVNAVGRDTWEGLVNVWRPVLSAAGLSIGDAAGAPRFYHRGDAGDKLRGLLRQWQEGQPAR